MQNRITALEDLQSRNVDSTIRKILSLVRSHEPISKDILLDQLLNLKILAMETKHDKSSYYPAVFQAMKEKLRSPVDQFTRYLLVLLGDKDQEKVFEKISKVDKSFDRQAPRTPYRRRGAMSNQGQRRIRCFNCQGFGHFARNCRLANQRPYNVRPPRRQDIPEPSTQN